MTGKLKRSLYIAIAAAMVLAVIATPVSADESVQRFTDVQPGEWYFEEVNAGAEAGFVLGYGDGTFRPGADVNRAELVKMLLAAAHLTPDSLGASYLHEATTYTQSGEAPADMDGHWLSKQGWTQVALDFGLILPSDYPDSAFLPNQPATRCEAAVMIVRMLGLAYPAQSSAEKELPFTDAETIEPSLRGYVFQAVEAGVLEGYPDGSFRGEKTISRAEAVSMVIRALSYMENGIDPEIQAYAEERWTSNGDPLQIEIPLSVPAQVIDGTVYLPARDVITANAALYDGRIEWTGWYPQKQQIDICYIYPFWFGSGITRYYTGQGEFGDNAYSGFFPVPARLLYGELMIPVYTPGVDLANLWGEVRWDAETKTVVIPLPERYFPMS